MDFQLVWIRLPLLVLLLLLLLVAVAGLVACYWYCYRYCKGPPGSYGAHHSWLLHASGLQVKNEASTLDVPQPKTFWIPNEAKRGLHGAHHSWLYCYCCGCRYWCCYCCCYCCCLLLSLLLLLATAVVIVRDLQGAHHCWLLHASGLQVTNEASTLDVP